MKTISNLQDDLAAMFGKLIEGMTPSELNTMMSFILTTFADDFPEIKATVYKLATLTANNTYKLYLESIAEEFLEVKICIPVNTKTKSVYNILRDDEVISEGYISLEEVYGIQLASDYINEMSSYSTPRKPIILSDSTGSFITIDRDCVLFASCERILDIDNISESIYSVLLPYSCYKFVDFIINRNFGNVLDMNKKIFDLMYSSIEKDMTSGDALEGITSISLSGLSISFNNQLQNYATTLGSLQNSISNPSFIEQMNKLKETHLKKFKRKKRVFYNFIF